MKYPSHVVSIKAATPGWQVCDNLVQSASSILHVKNGTQQTRKTPRKAKEKQDMLLHVKVINCRVENLHYNLLITQIK